MKEYRIEHKVIDPETGIERDARKDDFLIENNDGVRRAFEIIAQWHIQRMREQILQSIPDSNRT
ncbi:MAG: hypothetical protein AB1814_02050 [Thermodesulfobacteriota bacterium]